MLALCRDLCYDSKCKVKAPATAGTVYNELGNVKALCCGVEEAVPAVDLAPKPHKRGFLVLRGTYEKGI